MDLRCLVCLAFLTNLSPVEGQSVLCPPGQWQCDDSSCIPDIWRCDGDGDCLDRSDEMDCNGASDCPPGQFSCVDSVDCVDSSARCDGKKQCPTGFDEENCAFTSGCLESDWTCRNNICIPKGLRCNGQNDCLDNSDEEDCDPCGEGNIQCPEGSCLPAEKRCDGQINCSDGSDEPITCGRECSRNNGGCSHMCVDEPWGAQCDCPDGYKLSYNGADCQDVDECSPPFAPCMQDCTNTDGSYYCHCKDGFTLRENSICEATGNATRIVTVQLTSIGLLTVKTQQFEVIQTAVFEPVALTFDLSRGLYYWADSHGSIHTSDGQQSLSIYTGERGIKSLACDWLNGQLYWTNQETQSIYMLTSDWKSHITVLSKHIRPSELVLLPVESSMFWINEGPGNTETIEKSWMDGSVRSSLLVLTAQAAHGLTADIAARRLYWISDFKKSIETVTVDGTGRNSFTGLFSRGALSLAVFESSFYWVDDKGLWQVPQNRPDQKKFIWKGILPLISIYHELQQPQGPSACAAASCDLCLLTKSSTMGVTCTCPKSKILLPDGKCEYPRFVYATSQTINLLEFRGRESSEVQLFSTGDGILSFDIAWYRHWLYWADERGRVQRTSLIQVKTEDVTTPIPVCLIKIDQRSGSLYWVSCNQMIIGTEGFDGRFPQKLYETTAQIQDLYLNWLADELLWLEGDRIFSMRKTGGGTRQVLRLRESVTSSIAFDLRANSLLWISKSAGLITMSLLQEKSHVAGKRWNISGSVAVALEPLLLTLSENVLTLWDRRDGRQINAAPVKRNVLGVIPALKEVGPVPTVQPCKKPSFLCPNTSVCLSQDQLCDGKIHCPTGDDERFCVSTCPSRGEFRCTDRSACVSKKYVCDGRSHCHDGSDEVNCPTLSPRTTQAKALRCRTGSMACSDGTSCVSYKHVCDGEVDCKDGSDEEACDAIEDTVISLTQASNLRTKPTITTTTTPTPDSTLPPCYSPSMLCPQTELCISPSHICNGIRDCPDGFDEKKCIKKCRSRSEFRCKDRLSCIPMKQVCDGHSHCFDGSDEADCPSFAPQTTRAKVLTCRRNSRMCRDQTQCVLYSHVCDGERDCRDGSDEDECDAIEDTVTPLTQASTEKTKPTITTTTTTTPAPDSTLPPCYSPSMLCPQTDLCISPSHICNGIRDCPDGFDEKKCIKKCRSRSEFRCKDRLSCIPMKQVCDGHAHCFDGSDEADCPSFAPQTTRAKVLTCRRNSRMCRDQTQCVLYSHVCDGERDCRDGSDEDECDAIEDTVTPLTQASTQRTKPTITTTATPAPASTLPPCYSPSMLCPQTDLCISPSHICNGIRDCPDGFDEKKCIKKCRSRSEFRCKDRLSCIPMKQVCDGHAHCFDGSDEADCPSFAPQTTRAKVLMCRRNSRMCRDQTQCVLYSHVCDGERDCRDGSDEDECDAIEDTVTPLTQASTEKTKPTITTTTTTPAPDSTLPPCYSPSILCPQTDLCISPSHICNGIRDCPDGFDEKKCIKKCRSRSEFRCKDRLSCIPMKQVCDGHAHCFDGSDEADCPSFAPQTTRAKVLTCRRNSRMCRDQTQCVLYSHVCDGERDCRDGSDEDECAVDPTTTVLTGNPPLDESPPVDPSTQSPPKLSCVSPTVPCPDSSACILQTQYCDGKDDCQDGSDEYCVNTCPYKTDFRCKDRRSCISVNLVCDGRAHCFDGSDEVNCPTIAPQTTRSNILKCRRNSRLCRDQTQCVLYSHICDGERDCRDGSDEDECGVTETPSTSSAAVSVTQSCISPSFACPGSSVCILQKQFCDGQRDCPDGSDENCLSRCPNPNDFLCSDNLSCVSTSLLCDGRSHCNDGSDELNCASAVSPAAPPDVLKCRRGAKPCKDGSACVLYSHVCDGENDCLDGSDEQGCPQTCKPGEFQCAHGKKCIPAAQVCDGRAQCLDQSDEVNCQKQTKTCEFHCADGKRCIPRKFLCDGDKDCPDGTDEVGCDTLHGRVTLPPTLSTTSRCVSPSALCPHSSVCISQNQICNGQKDCPDGFDEDNCMYECQNPADFLCSDRSKCIPKRYVCDNRIHCADESDEKQCKSEPTTPSPTTQASVSTRPTPVRCRIGSRSCKDGLECVLHSHVCDGETDCKDGSDEEDCATKCKEGQFQCSHGKKCIPQQQVCDGHSDCQDRSDEMNCTRRSEGCHLFCDNKTRCIPESFLCDGERDCTDGSDEEKCGSVLCPPHEYRCTSGQCVGEALRCDGYADCRDHSDEKGCSRPPRCLTEIQCPHSHECLQKEWICDGEEDCKDGSDEKNCGSPLVECREHQWHCGDSSQCIPLSWRCDGITDCRNGKDEDKCSQRKCPPHLYQCSSGECVEPRLVCNGIRNCADRSEEGAGCVQRNCSSPSAPRCDHHCVSTPNGPRCFCAAGFKLHSSGLSCVDIDECNASPHIVCKHICLNTRGSYVCHCHPGFYLEPDNKSCKTEDEPLLLASVQSEMLLLGVHSATLRLLSARNRPVFSLDYHWAQQRVYWLSSNYESIRWTDMNNPNSKGTLIKGVKSDFIAVDWVGKNLYWVDGLVGQILAVKLSDVTLRSQNYTVVLGEDLEQPSSLVLLSHRGLMLWSEIGSTPQIERSGMDGSRRKVVVSRGLIWPVSLTFDLLDSRIYWVDEKLHCIGSASLDGDNVKILQLAETPSPFSVAVFNDRIFWSDTMRRTIRSADKNTGKDQKILLKRPGQPFGLKLMHAFSQPSISSPCDQIHCSHLCLLTPAGRGRIGQPTAVCRCPKGLLLSKDKITCSLPAELSFILLLSQKKVYQIPLQSMHRDGVTLKKMPNSRVLSFPGLTEASALDTSIPGLSLYVADAGQGSVDVLKMSSSRSRQGLTPAGHILKLMDDAVTALAVDWVTSNLYWSSTQRPDLHATAHTNNYTAVVLLASMKETTSIALHPPSSKVCYAGVGVAGTKSLSEVNCAWMDGRKKTLLWKKSTIPTSLVFSSDGTVIFWADAAEGIISCIGLDGSGFRQYKPGPGLLISLTYVDNILIWVTLDKEVTKLWFSDGLQPKQLWFETKTSLIEVKAYSNNSQSGTNSCSNNNGGCVQLCLPYPGGRTCTCGRGFYTVNVTSCLPLPICPAQELSCSDGSKCISRSKFCDGRLDCEDESDELDCPNKIPASSRTETPPLQSPPSNIRIDATKFSAGLANKASESCDLSCNGHGTCVTEGMSSGCRCEVGYSGDFCQEAERGRGHAGVGLGLFCLVVLLAAAAVFYVKRKSLVLMFNKSKDKESLVGNIVLPPELFDSDSEEVESPIDVKSAQLGSESPSLK